MKPLICSSSTSPFTTKNSNFLFSSSFHFHPSSHPLVYFPLNKLPSLHLISHQPTNLLHPIHSSSPPPPPTDLDLDLTETVNDESCESKTVHVKFQLKKECSFGEQFAIVGDDPNFGMWDPDNAIPLIWSDDHVWNLELDLPIGKSIHFKFILKQISGSILWQPGPDRILETWETTNTIVVCEDWEDATSRKLLEEELVFHENVGLTVNSETTLVEENFIQQNISDVKEEELIVEVESNPEKEPLPSTDESNPEKAIIVVTDNMSNPNEELDVNENGRISKEEHEEDSNEKILEKKERKPEVAISEKYEDVEEGDPVLVLGLPLEPLNHNEIGDDCEGVKSTSDLYSLIGANEVEIQNSPELEEKHDSEIIQPGMELQQKLNTYEEIQQIPNKVVENDIQWGRRTIQRLLTMVFGSGQVIEPVKRKSHEF